MIYGDGDGAIFADFAQSTDVIAHELTHGVTQYSAQLCYTDDAGGLNESISTCSARCFVNGAPVRQWPTRTGSSVMTSWGRAPWQGALRVCVTWRIRLPSTAWHGNPISIRRSGRAWIPLHEWSSKPCVLRGRDGDRGQKLGDRGANLVSSLDWLAPDPNLGMSAFAARTRRLAQSMFPRDASVYAAVNEAWVNVGL